MPAPTSQALKRLESEILQLDPDGRFVTLDIKTRSITYSSEIRSYEHITWHDGEEEPVRAYIVCWLCTEGGYLPTNIELEKQYTIGRPKTGAQLDILVNHPDGSPFALIEVKPPAKWRAEADPYIDGQLFKIAPHEPGASVLSFVTAHIGEVVHPEAITIRYAGQSFQQWASARAFSTDIPANYGEATHQHYVAQGARLLKDTVTQQELDRLRKRLHDVLWRGSTPDNQIYEYVVKLFLTKIFDEKDTRVGKRYQFQRFYTGSTPESSASLFARINKRYIEAYNRYLNISGGDQAEPLNASIFSAEQTAFVVELLQGLALTSTNKRVGDLLGGFFEGITREGFKQSKGLFFTHLNIAIFLLLVLDLPALAIQKITSAALYSARLPYIIDPSCGSGTFLMAAMHMVTTTVQQQRSALAITNDIADFLDQKFPTDHPNAWATEFIFGVDQSELLAMSTKVNMVLHRDGNTHVYNADGLAPLSRYTDQRLKPQGHPAPSSYTKPVAGSFDIVVTNPPFSITLDPATLDAADSTFELANTPNSENLFLERWYQLLKPHGRLGAVMPESFFATRENLQARLFLLDHFRIVAIVSLPRQAFEPWTPTRTSLLFAEKKTADDEAAWLDARRLAESEVSLAFDELSDGLRSLRTMHRSISPSIIDDFACALKMRLRVGSLAALGPAIQAIDKKLNRARPQAGVLTPELRTVLRKLRGFAQKSDQYITTVISSASELEVSGPDLNASMSLAELDIALGAWEAAARRVDVSVWAVRRIVSEFDYDFPIVSVEEIGYKRTKRTEYARRNRLFSARSLVDGKLVPNLNLADGPWEVCDDDAAKTILTQIRDVITWH